MENEFEPPLQPPVISLFPQEIGGSALRASQSNAAELDEELDRTLRFIEQSTVGTDEWS